MDEIFLNQKSSKFLFFLPQKLRNNRSQARKENMQSQKKRTSLMPMIRLPPLRPRPRIIINKLHTPPPRPTMQGRPYTHIRLPLPIIQPLTRGAPNRLGGPFLTSFIGEEVYAEGAVPAPVEADVVGLRGEFEAVPAVLGEFGGEGFSGAGGVEEGADGGAVVPAFFDFSGVGGGGGREGKDGCGAQREEVEESGGVHLLRGCLWGDGRCLDWVFVSGNNCV